MKLKAMVMGAATAALFAIPTVALADWGQVTGDVNLRAGPGTGYQRITTLPGGARIWVNGAAGNGWVSVTFNGLPGYVSGSYVAYGNAYIAPRPYYAPPPPPPYYTPGPQVGIFVGRPPPPTYGYWRKPWWDDRYDAWYDGRRWYRDGDWYEEPSGFSFGINIGG